MFLNPVYPKLCNGLACKTHLLSEIEIRLIANGYEPVYFVDTVERNHISTVTDWPYNMH